MKKLIAALLMLAGFTASSQTLFHYGKDSVLAKEFIKAYEKNNAGDRSEKAFTDYLELYINARLKIKEAKARGYDTLPQLVADLEGLRQQILPAYITDKASVNKMIEEAFARSQKDIHLVHIFIAAKGNDTVEAAKKLIDVVAELKKDEANKNASFSQIAQKYSNDPSVKSNGGDIGFITVFTLPYELENLAYSTPVGKISAVYKSKAGYHIFKNLGERKALGRMKAAQILLAFPPDADEQTKTGVKKLADSLYNRLLKGDDFGKLASQFSNDMVSSANNGQMQEFGVGQYDGAFEKNAFALPADGAISKPFLTGHGYHIVKRISKLPVPATKTKEVLAALQEKIEQGDRMNAAKARMAKKIAGEAAYKKAVFMDAELWAYSDSVLNNQAPKMALHLNNTSPLFSFSDKTITVSDWITYAQNFRFKADGSGIKAYAQVWDEFMEATAMDYYQSHLENFNEEFRQQVDEFRDGNLFFEIMQRQIWGPAQSDSAALAKFYDLHKSNYNWKQSADAVVFYASDLATANSFIKALKKSPTQWQQLVNGQSEKLAADSSRFELSQIPNPTRLPWKAGTITAPLVNKTDNTASFAYIIRYYAQQSPRSFAESKALVVTDYQNELEKKWLDELRKKYPVSINQKLLEELKRKELARER